VDQTSICTWTPLNLQSGVLLSELSGQQRSNLDDHWPLAELSPSSPGVVNSTKLKPERIKCNGPDQSLSPSLVHSIFSLLATVWCCGPPIELHVKVLQLASLELESLSLGAKTV
jgi:hypothetical protein